jgi:hypothetical protein
MTSDNFFGTPLPPEEPQAQNPMRGAYVDYYLDKPATGPVVLEIINSQNQVIRRYSSADKQRAPETDVPIAPRWLQKPPSLATEAGMHRFVWDLRYGRTGEPGESDSDDDDGPGRWLGPLVTPANYKVRLTVNGRSFAKPLRVVMDPRSQITPAELEEQFQWSRRAFDAMIKARRAVAEIRGLQSAIGKFRGTQYDAVGSDLKSAKTQTGQILTGDPNKNDGLEEASRSLTAALNALQSADRTPPSQVIQLYKESSQSLEEGLASWTTYKSNELPALNEKLRTAGLQPLQLSRIEEEAEESIAR